MPIIRPGGGPPNGLRRYLHPDLRQRNFGITGSDAMIKISEHWTVKKRQGHLDLVAYFEPQTLLRSSALNPALCAHPKEIWP